jgi:hypothetical protein
MKSRVRILDCEGDGKSRMDREVFQIKIVSYRAAEQSSGSNGTGATRQRGHTGQGGMNPDGLVMVLSVFGNGRDVLVEWVDFAYDRRISPCPRYRANLSFTAEASAWSRAVHGF